MWALSGVCAPFPDQTSATQQHGGILPHCSCVYLVRGITCLNLLIRPKRKEGKVRNLFTLSQCSRSGETPPAFLLWDGKAAAWMVVVVEGEGGGGWWRQNFLSVSLYIPVHWGIIERSESRAFIQRPWLALLKPEGSVVIQLHRGAADRKQKKEEERK